MVSYLTTLFLGKSPEVNLPVNVFSAHFSPVTGSLLSKSGPVVNLRVWHNILFKINFPLWNQLFQEEQAASYWALCQFFFCKHIIFPKLS